jgi:hypothetical protein
MIKESSSFFKLLEEFIVKTVEKHNQKIDLYIVKEINEEQFTVNIKHPNFKTLEFNDVPVSSIGLGNFKGGVMKLPSENDYVIVLFLGENLENPIVLGTIFNTSDVGMQKIPQIKKDELFLNNKNKGSYILINYNNDIIIKSCDSNGVKKGLVKIDSDGNIYLNEGTLPIARQGDTVSVSVPTVGTCTGTITSGNNRVRA